jgi:D-alanyl-D-alanine carboxypeptidase
MRLASVSKAFSGAVALSLVADGTLSLGDTVGKWLPGLPPA